MYYCEGVDIGKHFGESASVDSESYGREWVRVTLLIDKLLQGPCNGLFVGEKGTGKTTCAELVMAKAGRFVLTVAGSTELQGINNVRKIGEVVKVVQRKFGPMIVFIDELHLVPVRMQEAFLPLMGQISKVSSGGVATEEMLGSSKVDPTRISVLAATTEESQVSAPFSDRCFKIQIRPRTPEALEKILLGKRFPQDISSIAAVYAGGTTRHALEIADAMRSKQTLEPETIGYFPYGLVERDLVAFAHVSQFAPVPTRVVRVLLGADAQTTTMKITHYQRCGLILMSSRGITLTERGRALLEKSGFEIEKVDGQGSSSIRIERGEGTIC